MEKQQPISNQGKFSREMAATLSNLYKMRVSPNHPRHSAINSAIEDAEELIFSHRDLGGVTPSLMQTLSEKIGKIAEMRFGKARDSGAKFGSQAPLTDEMIQAAVNSQNAAQDPNGNLKIPGIRFDETLEDRTLLENIHPILEHMRLANSSERVVNTAGIAVRTPDDFGYIFCPVNVAGSSDNIKLRDDLVLYKVNAWFKVDDFEGVREYLEKHQETLTAASIALTPIKGLLIGQGTGWAPMVCFYESEPDRKALSNDVLRTSMEMLAYLVDNANLPGRMIKLKDGGREDYYLYTLEEGKPKLLGRVVQSGYLNQPLETSQAYVNLLENTPKGDILYEKVGALDAVEDGKVVETKVKTICIYSSFDCTPKFQRILEETLGVGGKAEEDR